MLKSVLIINENIQIMYSHIFSSSFVNIQIISLPTILMNFPEIVFYMLCKFEIFIIVRKCLNLSYWSSYFQ